MFSATIRGLKHTIEPGFVMKTSLLVIGLPMLIGSMGTAHAATEQSSSWTTQTTQPTLASATLDRSADATSLDSLVPASKATQPASISSHRDAPDPNFLDTATTLPSPNHAPHNSRRARPGSSKQRLPSVIGAIDTDIPEQPAAPSSTEKHPALGWQSLLPGSIQ